MLAIVTALAISCGASPDDPAASKEPEPPAKEVLSAITDRGRSLAGYDDACWHASDSLVAKKPKAGSVARYIARKTENGWVVAFGRLDDKKDRFLVAYEATQGKKPDVFTVKEITPPREDNGFLRSAARSIDTALKDFRGQQRPYNVAVLPADASHFWVYVVPAPTKVGVWPLGGDVRYRISPDGAKIVEKHPMHKSILDLPAPERKEGEEIAASVHTHLLSDIPEDSDVFFVLTRKPSVPDLVVSQRFVFEVGVDGGIKYIGKPDKLPLK